MIQEDNTESDFQFYEGNEEELETNNINFDLAEDMLDEDMPRENDGQIQDYKNELYKDLTFKCEDGQALRRIKSEYEKKDRRWDFGCTPRTVSALYYSPLQSVLVPAYIIESVKTCPCISLNSNHSQRLFKQTTFTASAPIH